MENKKNNTGDILSPFVLSLPRDVESYFEILDVSKSVTMRSGLVVLHAGESVGSHNTGDNEEILIILKGYGEVECEGLERYKIEQGSIAYVPPDTRHNVFNQGTQILQYIYVVAKVK
jgi:mannose-6-phosphate isomerase-like protein (cupin superfamily)